MNYEAINRFTREKEMGKEKRTFGTGWKFQPVPQGPIWDLVKKKWWDVARESNRVRGAQITERCH